MATINVLQSPSGTVMTVTGPVPNEALGLTDAHTHVWIAPVAGAPPHLPRLYDQAAITAELKEFREVGGGTLVDCQPGGCGRDGRILLELARASGVQLVACTGFHLEHYYPPDFWLYRPECTVDQAQAHFVRELTEGLEETRLEPEPVRAGFIKIACEATLETTPAHLLSAAAAASQQTGAAIEVHTEKGADAERIVSWFYKYGLDLQRLVICHLDKRPDLGLHRELAQQGVMLEYDTFYRPKYQPEQNVWPLLEQMVAAGLEDRLALATDMAEAAMWSRLGGGPGLTAFVTHIKVQLQAIGFESSTVVRLLGQNIAGRLVCQTAS